ncbi:DHS-like NAD/FAD-binding domain-containing protein [Pisolithus microcarpus]|nr:DHS-like NAD/FAD-binding domain-containing protein [Pisolithus microcarpus]
MLRAANVLARSAARSYATATATAASPHALVFLEHCKGNLDSSSLSALTAASQLGGRVSGLVVGTPEDLPAVLEQAKKVTGLDTVLHSASPQYMHAFTRNRHTLLLSTQSPFTHVVSAHSSSAKSILPRVAAKLGIPAVSDITSVQHDSSSNSTTFTRPIYAGNAISTVRASDSIPIKFFTVRSTAFSVAALGDGEAKTESVDPVHVSNPSTEHVSTSLTKSDRPDLGVASRVVSGGRALKNAETFKATLFPLADALGAAVGASRAAVDAGYADNSLQVGQTGKVVAPELYMAIGISGAIQHLAGMKDSKLIVAINKDPDAPIFQVADVGLVADLFEAVPEMVEKLK